MIEAKFTAGPWVKDKYGRLTGANGVEVKVNSFNVANVYASEESMANTSLLEVAPEMYKALERQRQALLNLIEFNIIFYSHVDDCNKEIKLIDQLLAKARGESNA